MPEPAVVILTNCRNCFLGVGDYLRELSRARNSACDACGLKCHHFESPSGVPRCVPWILVDRSQEKRRRSKELKAKHQAEREEFWSPLGQEAIEVAEVHVLGSED